jgi:hypothetical protein
MTGTHLLPDRAALSGPVSGATFLTALAGALTSADVPYPRPGSDAATIRRFFHGNRRSAQLSAAGQLLSAATLGRFTGSVIRLARATDSPAVTTAAITGGVTAVASLATSAALTAALATDLAGSDERAVALHRRAFLAGGIAHGAGFGLLVGALGLAGRRTGILPESVARLAAASAAAGLLSPLYLVAEPAAWLIPAGRFSGLVVTAIAGVRMARPLPERDRERRRTRSRVRR